MKFILYFFTLNLISLGTYSQLDTFALKKIAVKKLTSIYKTSDEIYAEIYGPKYFNVIEIFYGLSSRYKVFSTSLTFHHYNGPNLVYVWDNKSSRFLDSVTVANFNDILRTSNISLNALEKSVLYLNLVYNETINNYYLNDSNKTKPLFPKFVISELLNHKYKDGCCFYWNTDKLLDYTSSSSELTLYLPYTFQKDELYFYSFRRFDYKPDGQLTLIMDLRSSLILPIGK
jgi:hypothetical protein